MLATPSISPRSSAAHGRVHIGIGLGYRCGQGVFDRALRRCSLRYADGHARDVDPSVHGVTKSQHPRPVPKEWKREIDNSFALVRRGRDATDDIQFAVDDSLKAVGWRYRMQVKTNTPANPAFYRNADRLQEIYGKPFKTTIFKTRREGGGVGARARMQDAISSDTVQNTGMGHRDTDSEQCRYEDRLYNKTKISTHGIRRFHMTNGTIEPLHTIKPPNCLQTFSIPLSCDHIT